MFVERIVFAKASFIEVLVFEESCAHSTIVPVEQVASVEAVPCLACLLEVAEVLEAHHELVTHVGEAPVVGAAASRCTMHIAVGAGLVVGPVEDPVVGKQAGRERAADIEGVVGAIGAGYFCRWLGVGRLAGEGDGTAEGAITIG